MTERQAQVTKGVITNHRASFPGGNPTDARSRVDLVVGEQVDGRNISRPFTFTGPDAGRVFNGLFTHSSFRVGTPVEVTQSAAADGTRKVDTITAQFTNTETQQAEPHKVVLNPQI